jgi:hypothetical protein
VPFVGLLEVEEIFGHADGKVWRLLRSLEYEGNEETFVVRAGFETDFASVPFFLTWLVPRYGRYTKAAVLHDHLWRLCREGRFKWADADGILRRAMRELEVPFLRRWLMWGAVRLASIFGHHDYSSVWRQGPGPFFALLVVTLAGVAFVIVPAIVVLTFLGLYMLAEGVAWTLLKLASVVRGKEPKPINRPRLFLRS